MLLMTRTARIVVLLSALLVGLVGAPEAAAQLRGGPPAGFPPGAVGGIPRGAPGHPGEHGPPPWVADRMDSVAPGLEHAPAVISEKLSAPEKVRAADLARANPGAYELDRNGALVVRGEVLVTGLDDAALVSLQRAGFIVDRREHLPDLGLNFAMVSRSGFGATDLLRQLRKLQPRGTYALNHVLFGSGTAAAAGARRRDEDHAPGLGHAMRVGLIDTGVSPRVDAPPRVRLVRRAFVAGAERGELHGTAVAALLAASPGPVDIYAAGIFTESRAGSSDLLLRGLGWLAGERVPVINISMVGPPNPIVSIAITTLVHKGYIIVAPVGNDGASARPLYPASYPGVIAVSAAGLDGHLLPEASRVERVDFVAPGIGRVLDPSGHETLVRGTSFAAPRVSLLLAERIRAPDPAAARAAVAALIHQARRLAADRRWSGYGLVAADQH